MHYVTLHIILLCSLTSTSDFLLLAASQVNLIPKMWIQKIVLKICLLFIVKCEFSSCLPLNHIEVFKFKISSANYPLNVIIPGNRDEITDISEIFTTDYWFPIEINVPDTFISAWEGAQSAWAFASDYFAMGNGEMSSTQGIN